MKILVTGGAGYVGSTLVPILLEKGYQVRVLDNLMHGGEPLLPVWSNSGFEFVRGDIRDKETVKQALAAVDAVVHLAAIVGDPACSRQPELAKAVNLDAFLDLLAECRKAQVSRLVVASTCSNYGKMKAEDAYVDENSELTPVSLYARTKVAMEEAILDPAQTNGLCATSLRFATIFGVSPRMRFDLTVNEFTMEMVSKNEVTVFGEQFWRPYIHVRDAARAILAVLEAEPSRVANEVFNVGSTEQNFTKKDLVGMIQPHAPKALVNYVHKDEDPRDYRVSFSKIERGLNFRCQHSVRDGIEEIARLISSGVINEFSDARFRN